MHHTPLISCASHDYIEITCLYSYQIKLLLKNKQTIEGKAVAISTCKKREYLLLDNGQEQKIELTEISELQVLTPKAKFQKISF